MIGCVKQSYSAYQSATTEEKEAVRRREACQQGQKKKGNDR